MDQNEHMVHSPVGQIIIFITENNLLKKYKVECDLFNSTSYNIEINNGGFFFCLYCVFQLYQGKVFPSLGLTIGPQL